MSARLLIAALALVAAACAPTPRSSAASLAPDASGAALAAACQGRDGWNDPAPPARLFGNVHYVGTCGIAVLLVTSPRGHILIDGAVADAAPGILANIRRLGFDPRDVRTLLSSHEHVDHAGGLAALKAATGARLATRAEGRAVYESGVADPSDPQAGAIDSFPPVTVDRVVADGAVVRVGPNALRAVATPGHTDGGTSWTWRACDAGACRTFVYADSLTAVSAKGYRFNDNPEKVARLRATLARVAALDCDVLITPHPVSSDLFGRLAGRAALADPRACVAYADAARRRLDARLAEEAAR